MAGSPAGRTCGEDVAAGSSAVAAVREHTAVADGGRVYEVQQTGCSRWVEPSETDHTWKAK